MRSRATGKLATAAVVTDIYRAPQHRTLLTRSIRYYQRLLEWAPRTHSHSRWNFHLISILPFLSFTPLQFNLFSLILASCICICCFFFCSSYIHPHTSSSFLGNLPHFYFFSLLFSYSSSSPSTPIVLLFLLLIILLLFFFPFNSYCSSISSPYSSPTLLLHLQLLLFFYFFSLFFYSIPHHVLPIISCLQLTFI